VPGRHRDDRGALVGQEQLDVKEQGHSTLLNERAERRGEVACRGAWMVLGA
jgi:hypothetical protein